MDEAHQDDAAAYNAVDKAEGDKAAVHAVNAAAVSVLAAVARDKGRAFRLRLDRLPIRRVLPQKKGVARSCSYMGAAKSLIQDALATGLGASGCMCAATSSRGPIARDRVKPRLAAHIAAWVRFCTFSLRSIALT